MFKLVRALVPILLLLLVFNLVQSTISASAATPEASVAFFQSISERQFLVGQMGAYGSGYTPAIVAQEMQLFIDASGQSPAIVGMDYWRADKTLDQSIGEANPILTDWYRRGAYVTLSTHFHNPFTRRGGVNDRTGNSRLTELLTPTTTAGARWQGWLDTVAAGLQQLEDNGVPVMWRPFHEMNGSWFWWGAPPNPDNFKALWRHMHDYLEVTKGLSNLIWVYSPNVGSNTTLYYPGDQYVDVIGLDKYMTLEETRGTQRLTLNGYTLLLAYSKPIYLSEFGVRPADASGQDIAFDYRLLLNDMVTLYPKLFGVLHWEWVWKLAYEYQQWGAVANTADDYMAACQTLSMNETPTSCGTAASATPTLMPSPTVSGTPPPIPPSATPAPPLVEGHGLKGQYYNDIGFNTTPVLTRTDSFIDVDWGRRSPATGINADQFSVCWTGFLVPNHSEPYTFYTRVDDGIRLWINGLLVFNSWTDKRQTTYIQSSFTVPMTADQLYPIQLEYYENTGTADVELSWSSASQYKQIIPQNYLMTGQGNTCNPNMQPFTPTPTITPTFTPSLLPTETVPPTSTPTLEPTLEPTVTLPPTLEPTQELPTALSFPTLDIPLTPVAPTPSLVPQTPLPPPLTATLNDSAPDWITTGGWTLVPDPVTGVGFRWDISAPETHTLTWLQQIDLRTTLYPQLTFLSNLQITGSTAEVQIEAPAAREVWNTLFIVTPDAQTVFVDLSAYRGQIIRIRFLWTGAPAPEGASSDTWSIDSVVIAEAPAETPTDVPPTETLGAPTEPTPTVEGGG